MASDIAGARRALLLVPLVAALAACGPQGQGGHGGPGGGMPPAPVAVQEVQPRTIPVEFEFPAQTAGSREVEVRARVPGILLKRNYEEGAPVRVWLNPGHELAGFWQGEALRG